CCVYVCSGGGGTIGCVGNGAATVPSVPGKGTGARVPAARPSATFVKLGPPSGGGTIGIPNGGAIPLGMGIGCLPVPVLIIKAYIFSRIWANSSGSECFVVYQKIIFSLASPTCFSTLSMISSAFLISSFVPTKNIAWAICVSGMTFKPLI